jgi:drug/metabolite transporter (DMT)-like permease
MDNLRGGALMTLAMLGFAFEDMFIKLMAADLPTWQIIAVLGIGGALVFGIILGVRRQPLFSRAWLDPAVVLRNACEAVGTAAFVSAITLIPLSTASAILQSTPLAVTLGAALMFREPVGWRRWSAILVGFAGVLLVIRPGMAGFDALSLLALLGVAGLALRDLATRKVPKGISSFQLSFMAFLTLVPTALLLGLFDPRPAALPTAAGWAMLAAAVGFGVLAYYALVAAMRLGEIGFVAPFRYSRLIFALVIGMVIFGERPDAMMLAGSAIIVASGIYTIWRERKLRRAARRPLSLTPAPR